MIGHRHSGRAGTDPHHADIDPGGELPRCVRPLRVKIADPVAAGDVRDGSASASSNVRARTICRTGPEDFVLIALHLRQHLVEQGRAEEEAALVALQGEPAAVEHQLRAFANAQRDVVLHPLTVGGGNHGAVLGIGVGGDAHLEPLDRREQARAQGLRCRLAHRHHHGQRHAALTGRAIGRPDDLAHRLVEVGVGQDDLGALGPTHGLDPLSVRRADSVDVGGDVGGAHEAHRGDVRMGEDGLHRLLVAVDDVEHAGRSTGLGKQLGQAQRDAGVLLRRLEDEGVAHRDGHGEHPHRDHGREVERGDARRHAQGLAHGIDVDPGTGALGELTLQGVRHATGEFHHLQPALDVAPGVRQHLSMFAGEQRGELVHAAFHQPLELEHHPRPPLRIHRPPGRLSLARQAACTAASSTVWSAKADARLHLAGAGVEHVGPIALDLAKRLAVDEVGDLTHGCLGWRVHIHDQAPR